MTTDFVIHCGDAVAVLQTLSSESVNCCITSPPYFGLRDYGVDGQLGLEQTPEQYIDRLIAVFREVRRVLMDDGTLWVNIGDCYAKHTYANIKPKNLIGIPWMLAFALRADGWYLRSEIIWQKPNVMPESITDRVTRSHEQIFLLSKLPKYYYDADAIREPHNEKYIQNRSDASYGGSTKSSKNQRTDRSHSFVKRYSGKVVGNPLGRNKRSVWTLTTKPFDGAHFAVFPPELPLTCILAGCPQGGVVLDPFSGAATTGIVAVQNGRKYVGIELNPEYVDLSNKRYAEAQADAVPARC